MKQYSALWLSALLFVFSGSIKANNSNWLLAAENFPPYSYQEGDYLSGIAVTHAQELLGLAMLEYESQIMPWARVVEYLDNRPNTITPAMAKTEERKAKYIWLGPFSSIKIYAWFKRDTDLTAITPQGRTVSVIRGSAAEKHLLTVQQITEENLLRVTSLEQMVGMLIKGRVDVIYVADNMEEDLQNIRADYADNSLTKGELLMELPLYIAISKTSDPMHLANLQHAAERILNAKNQIIE
ncbi:MAG: transporter substrate-binding domain-containing protein [Alteromonadaceae bacterium]|nr:transporter substrate-binding domain-containing protein [Alteromonadaceae bacterium]